ncbi:MAG: type II secretion system F family protein [Endomicrobium sp.]|jgi:tight adherence protein B|nr:type II secretion system F family protein [Endomicrobium sp.]
MKKLVVIGLLSIFVFYCVYLFLEKMKAMRKKRNFFNFKNLSVKTKTLIISLIVFLFLLILIRNIIFVLIFYILYLYFNWYIKDKNERRYANLLDQQVIEALTVIKNIVQVGQSLQNAMIIAKHELKEPIKFEFEQISNSLSLGMDFGKVLEEISQKTKSKEFKLMLDTIRISKDTGASLKDIFDRIVDSTSKRITMQSKISTLTAQGRMSGNIVSAVPFIIIVMMYIIEPDMVKPLFATLSGNILLLIVVVMVLAGSFVMRKMMEIDF